MPSQVTKQDTAIDAKQAGKDEAQLWQGVRDLIEAKDNENGQAITLGHHWSFNLWNDPKRLAFVLSRYKFAAKMGGQHRSVLELGSSEGIGAPILAEFATEYVGVDLDQSAIETAQTNFSTDKCRFLSKDFLGRRFECQTNAEGFDTVISLDVCEHIMPEHEENYFDTIRMNLNKKGMAIIGTPNETSDQYASPMSKAGHVNLFDHNHMRRALGRLFHNVFLFGINDEVVHTGFSPMAHYLIAIGCNLRDTRE